MRTLWSSCLRISAHTNLVVASCIAEGTLEEPAKKEKKSRFGKSKKKEEEKPVEEAPKEEEKPVEEAPKEEKVEEDAAAPAKEDEEKQEE